MPSLALPTSLTDPDHSTFRLSTAVVSEVHASCFVVVDAQPRHAQRAASCLIEPQVGDTVLMAREQACAWIVAVLVTAGLRELKLHGTTLSAHAQRIDINAQDLHTTSAQLQASHGAVRLAVSELFGQVAAVQWLSESISACVNRLFSRSRTVFREVSEIDSTRCTNHDLKVDETLAISAKTGVITGQSLMKIDAAQIHIG
jgi:hypothetical protein